VDEQELSAMIVFVRGWGDEKQRGDLTVSELYQGIYKIKPMQESAFRRVLRGLGLVKNSRGFYSRAHAIAIVGWIERGHKFGSYAEYMECFGRSLYQSAVDVDFTKFVAYEREVA
jgi:hypothetical protein